MDSVSRAVGSSLPVWIGGRLRLVRPLTLAMFGSMELYLLDSRRDMADIVMTEFGRWDYQAVELLRFAIDADQQRPHYIPSDELNGYLDTPEGLTMALWLMTRDTEPSWDWDAISELLRGEESEQRSVLKSVRLVSALDEMADKDWMRIAEDQGSATDRMNWKHLVRKLCEVYFGMTPNDIGQMTIYQVRCLSLSEGNVKGLRLSVAEFRRLQQAGQLDKTDIRWQTKKKGA